MSKKVTLCLFTLYSFFHLIFENVMDYWGYKIAFTIKPYLLKLMSLISLKKYVCHLTDYTGINTTEDFLMQQFVRDEENIYLF